MLSLLKRLAVRHLLFALLSHVPSHGGTGGEEAAQRLSLSGCSTAATLSQVAPFSRGSASTVVVVETVMVVTEVVLSKCGISSSASCLSLSPSVLEVEVVIVVVVVEDLSPELSPTGTTTDMGVAAQQAAMLLSDGTDTPTTQGAAQASSVLCGPAGGRGGGGDGGGEGPLTLEG